MEFNIITQEYLDNLQLYLADKASEMANKTLTLYCSGDPDYLRLKREVIVLQNVIHALRYYDITAEILTEKNILKAEELAISIIQNCPY